MDEKPVDVALPSKRAMGGLAVVLVTAAVFFGVFLADLARGV